MREETRRRRRGLVWGREESPKAGAWRRSGFVVYVKSEHTQWRRVRRESRTRKQIIKKERGCSKIGCGYGEFCHGPWLLLGAPQEGHLGAFFFTFPQAGRRPSPLAFKELNCKRSNRRRLFSGVFPCPLRWSVLFVSERGAVVRGYRMEPLEISTISLARLVLI